MRNFKTILATLIAAATIGTATTSVTAKETTKEQTASALITKASGQEISISAPGKIVVKEFTGNGKTISKTTAVHTLILETKKTKNTYYKITTAKNGEITNGQQNFKIVK